MKVISIMELSIFLQIAWGIEDLVEYESNQP